MGMMGFNVEVWVAVVVVAVSYAALQVVRDFVWEPLKLRLVMAKQGVKGPPFRFLVGQHPDQSAFLASLPAVIPVDSYAALAPTVTPIYALFFPQFPEEKYFLYWWGNVTRLVVRDPEMAKEIFVKNHDSLKWSPSKSYLVTQIYGKGLLIHVGEKWTAERRAINPFFHQDTLKGMVEAMVEGSTMEIQRWERIVAQAGHQEFRTPLILH